MPNAVAFPESGREKATVWWQGSTPGGMPYRPGWPIPPPDAVSRLGRPRPCSTASLPDRSVSSTANSALPPSRRAVGAVITPNVSQLMAARPPLVSQVRGEGEHLTTGARDSSGSRSTVPSYAPLRPVACPRLPGTSPLLPFILNHLFCHITSGVTIFLASLLDTQQNKTALPLPCRPGPR